MFQADHLLAFTLAATLLTVTPGLDTALVLRTAATEGGRRAFQGGLGIAAGCIVWGFLAAAGLGALLAASEFAYTLLRWVGAAYLLYLGITLIRSPRTQFVGQQISDKPLKRSWFRTGFLTNILNPKVGVFYVSFLPQFIPPTSDVPLTTVVLTTIHALLGILWFSVLILATRPITRFLREPKVVSWLDRVTGGMFLVFAAKLVTSART